MALSSQALLGSPWFVRAGAIIMTERSTPLPPPLVRPATVPGRGFKTSGSLSASPFAKVKPLERQLKTLRAMQRGTHIASKVPTLPTQATGKKKKKKKSTAAAEEDGAAPGDAGAADDDADDGAPIDWLHDEVRIAAKPRSMQPAGEWEDLLQQKTQRDHANRAHFLMSRFEGLVTADGDYEGALAVLMAARQHYEAAKLVRASRRLWRLLFLMRRHVGEDCFCLPCFGL